MMLWGTSERDRPRHNRICIHWCREMSRKSIGMIDTISALAFAHTERERESYVARAAHIYIWINAAFTLAWCRLIVRDADINICIYWKKKTHICCINPLQITLTLRYDIYCTFSANAAVYYLHADIYHSLLRVRIDYVYICSCSI